MSKPPCRAAGPCSVGPAGAAVAAFSTALFSLLGVVVLCSQGTPARAAALRTLPAPAPGFPLLFPRTTDYRPRLGATVAADLDHDGRQELVASIPSGVITVIGRGGTRPGWPQTFGAYPWPAYPVGSPGIGDLDGDGHDDIVACLNVGASPRRVVLTAWRADGTVLPGWPITVPTTARWSACSSAGTAVADLDGDGRAEVIQAVSPSAIWAFGGDGAALLGWPFLIPPGAGGDTRSVSAALAIDDLDGDGRREVIAADTGLGPRLFALRPDGTLLPSFPRGLGEVIDVQAPVTGDLDRDGLPEIVQATLPVSHDLLRPPTLDPSRVPFLKTADSILGLQPAAPAPDPSGSGALHLLLTDGSEAPGWPTTLGSSVEWGSLVADLDGDGTPEVFQGDGDLLRGFDARGVELKGFPLTVHRIARKATDRLDSQWVIEDLDGDGAPDFLRAFGALDIDGQASLEIVAFTPPGGRPMRGTPFTFDGLLPASDPVALDLTGDGRPEIAILASEGPAGAWRLLAWDVWGGRRNTFVPARHDIVRMPVSLAPAPSPAPTPVP
jgi:hypothetical protein